MRIPYPNRLQWVVIWCTVVVSGHFWLELRLADWLPAVRQAVPGQPAAPAASTEDLGGGWTLRRAAPQPSSFPAPSASSPQSPSSASPANLAATGPSSQTPPAIPRTGRYNAPPPAAQPAPVERKVLWRESAWGLAGYLQPAIDYHRERLALAVVVVGLLLVWQLSRVSNRRPAA